MSEARPQNLIRVEGYPNWYQNPVTGELVFRKHFDNKAIKIFTGIVGKINPKTGKLDGIAAARRIVDEELERRKSEKSEEQQRRDREGVTDPLLEDIWNDMLVEKLVGKEEGTKANYHKDWKHGIAGFWADKTVSQVTRENVVLYKAWYITEKSDRLPEKTLDFFGMFMRYLVQQNYIAKLPDLTPLDDLDEVIKKMKRYEKAGRVFTDVEEKALLKSWQRFLDRGNADQPTRTQRIQSGRARCGVALGLLCGLRAQEVLKLKLSDIDYKNGIIRVWSQKNHQWREVPLVPYVADAIRYQAEQTKYLNSAFLFPAPKNPTRTVSAQNFAEVWHQCRVFAGIAVAGPFDARFHDLRKTFATRTAEQGWPWKVACEILDMSGDVYEKTYASKITFGIKAKFMLQTFSPEVDK